MLAFDGHAFLQIFSKSSPDQNNICKIVSQALVLGARLWVMYCLFKRLKLGYKAHSIRRDS